VKKLTYLITTILLFVTLTSHTSASGPGNEYNYIGQPVLVITNATSYLNLNPNDRNYGREIRLKLENYDVKAENTKTFVKSNTDNDWVRKDVSKNNGTFFMWVNPYKDYQIKMQICQPPPSRTAYEGINCREFSNVVSVTRAADGSDPWENPSPTSQPSPTLTREQINKMPPSEEALQILEEKKKRAALTPTPTHLVEETKQLQDKIKSLEKQLDESKKRQSFLEERIAKLTTFLTSLFSFK
jgi:hypothetical protein